MMPVCIVISIESDCLEISAEGEGLPEDTVYVERGIGIIGKLKESCLVSVNWVGNMKNA